MSAPFLVLAGAFLSGDVERVLSHPVVVRVMVISRGEDTAIQGATEEKLLRFVDEEVAEKNRVRTLKGKLSAEKELIGDRPSGELPDEAPHRSNRDRGHSPHLGD